MCFFFLIFKLIIDRFISPCLCKGSLRYVHRQCLEYWLSQSKILHCELCMYNFQTESTLRYVYMNITYRNKFSYFEILTI